MKVKQVQAERQLFDIEQVVGLAQNNACNTFISEDKESFLFIDEEDYCKMSVKGNTISIQGEADFIDGATALIKWEPIELVHAEYKALQL